MRWQTRKVFRFEVNKKRKIYTLKENNEEELAYGTQIADGKITLTLDVKAANEANCSEPWRKRHARHKAQKKAIFVAMLQVKHLISIPCTLRFTRYAPKMLDAHDNLRMSMKWICDQTCAEITGEHRAGLADNMSGLSFEYDQIKHKKYAVKIEITF